MLGKTAMMTTSVEVGGRGVTSYSTAIVDGKSDGAAEHV